MQFEVEVRFDLFDVQDKPEFFDVFEQLKQMCETGSGSVMINCTEVFAHHKYSTGGPEEFYPLHVNLNSGTHDSLPRWLRDVPKQIKAEHLLGGDIGADFDIQRFGGSIHTETLIGIKSGDWETVRFLMQVSQKIVQSRSCECGAPLLPDISASRHPIDVCWDCREKMPQLSLLD